MPKRGGISRRSLFGLGLSRLGERVDAAVPAPRASGEAAPPSLDDLRRRWAAARGATPLWAPAGEAVRTQAGDLTGAAVLIDGLAPPAGVAAIGRATPDGAPLPAGGGTFDAALSAFGVQRTPDGAAVLAEFVRTVRPGGRIVLTVWTEGPVLALVREAAGADPLPPGLPGAWAWGDGDRLRSWLDRLGADVELAPATLELEFDGSAAALDALGPAVPAVGAALVRGGRPAREYLGAALGGRAPGATCRVPVPYLVADARVR